MKGYELIEKIAKGYVEEGTKFLFKCDSSDIKGEIEVTWTGENFKVPYMGKCLTSYRKDIDVFTGEFTMVNAAIDIQAIEELDKTNSETMNEVTISDKINELIKAVKQLDKK